MREGHAVRASPVPRLQSSAWSFENRVENLLGLLVGAIC